MNVSSNVTIRKNTINDNLVEYFNLDDFIVNYENDENQTQEPNQEKNVGSNPTINFDNSQKTKKNNNKSSQVSILDNISKPENVHDILDQKDNNIILTTKTNIPSSYINYSVYSLDDLLTNFDSNVDINETQTNTYLISEKNVFPSSANINVSTKINSKAKGLYYISPTDFFKKCIKIKYSPFVTEGNKPITSYVERTAQILKSGALGGTVQFFPNGNQNGEREGQPGGIVPPLRNRF
jgi:hypothetical protein